MSEIEKMLWDMVRYMAHAQGHGPKERHSSIVIEDSVGKACDPSNKDKRKSSKKVSLRIVR